MTEATTKRRAPAKPKAQPQVAEVVLDDSGDRRSETHDPEKVELPLVVIEKDDALSIFSDNTKLMPILTQIEKAALNIAPDTSTAKGRKEIASVAFKVAQAKTYIDGVGKELVADLKELPKKIDEQRRIAREFLDGVRDKVRDPLNKWEEQQAKAEAEAKAKAEAEALAKQVEADHEMGLMMNQLFDVERAKQREAEEKARVEREERIAREARERAIAEEAARQEAAQKAALQAKEDAERRAREAEEEAARAKARAELAAREAAERAEREAREAAARAEREKQQAVEAERQRAAQAQAAAEREEKQRAANREHCRKVNSEALADLMLNCGLNEQQAKTVITAIVSGKINHISIKY